MQITLHVFLNNYTNKIPRGIGPGPIQTWLHSLRQWLGVGNFGLKEELLYCLCCENKNADQLRGYREADLHLCFRIFKKKFSHDSDHFA